MSPPDALTGYPPVGDEYDLGSMSLHEVVPSIFPLVVPSVGPLANSHYCEVLLRVSRGEADFGSDDVAHEVEEPHVGEVALHEAKACCDVRDYGFIHANFARDAFGIELVHGR